MKVECLNVAGRSSYSRSPENKGILNKGSDVIISIYDIVSKILSSSLNYVEDVVQWPNFGYVNIFAREVNITQILWEFDQKNWLYWEDGFDSISIIWEWH